MDNKMFCFQCQETAGCKGCTVMGICGKKPEVAAVQDLLVYVTKGLGAVAAAWQSAGKIVPSEIGHLITENLFITITNANFDEEAIKVQIDKTLIAKSELLKAMSEVKNLPEAALWQGSRADYLSKASTVGVLSTPNEDIRSLSDRAL